MNNPFFSIIILEETWCKISDLPICLESIERLEKKNNRVIVKR